MKEQLSTLYTKTGKLKNGMTVQRDFTEEKITVLASLGKEWMKSFYSLRMLKRSAKTCFEDSSKYFNQRNDQEMKTIERPKKEKLPEKKIILI